MHFLVSGPASDIFFQIGTVIKMSSQSALKSPPSHRPYLCHGLLKKKKKTFVYAYLVCLMWVWRSEDNFVALELSFHLDLGSRD